MEQLEIKQLSSLEKVFLNSTLGQSEYTCASALQGEVFSYQIAYRSWDSELNFFPMRVTVKSELAEFISLRCVENVPSELPAYKTLFGGADEDYITTTPGLFPDLLCPITDTINAVDNCWKCLWVTVKVPESATPGCYTIRILFEADRKTWEVSFQLWVIGVCLPEQQTIYTQWLHGDCLYAYYHEKPFSDRHWVILENFIKTAADNGINMILTPLFTPPLDTDIGGERTTIQLVGISRQGGQYSFDFSKLEKWVAICRRCGIKYFEMPHFFTQWGAEFTPKIIVFENGMERKLFGWNVPSSSPEYQTFLRQFIPSLTAELRKLGIAEKVFFHVSDEPKVENKESYLMARKIVKELLNGFRIIDTVSDYELYQKLNIDTPIVSLEHLKPYLEKPPKHLWAYNCCAQSRGVSNRFMAMPSYRNRIIGFQMYRFQIEGFLHWGYNFYYSGRSRKLIDPYRTTDALNAFPSGDSFSVYPGKDGKPLESIRLVVFHEALQDIRALELFESFVGRRRVTEFIHQEFGDSFTFFHYPKNPASILKLREKMNFEIKACAKNNLVAK